jgi:hypothetical protein
MKISTKSIAITSAAFVDHWHSWMPAALHAANLLTQAPALHHYTPEARSC